MRRAIGIPAAMAVLVAFPVIVAQTTAKDEGPEAKEAALTLNLEGDEGGADPYRFAVAADGPAPTETGILHDASGRHTAKVLSAEGCEGKARIAFPASGKRWCLQLQNVDPGHELVGSIVGGATSTTGARTLKLTVNRRDDFWGLPLAIVISGIVLGALVTLVKPLLKKPIRQSVLGGMLRKNQRAEGSARIRGLTEFARDRLAAGEDIEPVIEKVGQALDQGPERAEAERAKLKAALGQIGAGDAVREHPAFVAATREASRSDNAVTDFYDEAGSLKAHPAAELEKGLEELVKYLGQAGKLRAAIDALAPEDRTAPVEALGRAELVAREAETPEEIRRVAGLLDEARGSLEKARAKVAASKRRRGVAGAPALPGKLGVSLAPAAPELGGGKLVATRAIAIAASVATLLFVAAFTVATVKHANYDPKLDFNSFSDYFALFSAALGSAAAGALVLLIGFWSPVPPAGE